MWGEKLSKSKKLISPLGYRLDRYVVICIALKYGTDIFLQIIVKVIY